MKTNCLTNNVSDMNIENFEMFLRQGNMAENTIAAYLYAVKEYYSRHKELNKRNLLVYKPISLRNSSLKQSISAFRQ